MTPKPDEQILDPPSDYMPLRSLLQLFSTALHCGIQTKGAASEDKERRADAPHSSETPSLEEAHITLLRFHWAKIAGWSFIPTISGGRMGKSSHREGDRLVRGKITILMSLLLLHQLLTTNSHFCGWIHDLKVSRKKL